MSKLMTELKEEKLRSGTRQRALDSLSRLGVDLGSQLGDAAAAVTGLEGTVRQAIDEAVQRCHAAAAKEAGGAARRVPTLELELAEAQRRLWGAEEELVASRRAEGLLRTELERKQRVLRQLGTTAGGAAGGSAAGGAAGGSAAGGFLGLGASVIGASLGLGELFCGAGPGTPQKATPHQPEAEAEEAPQRWQDAGYAALLEGALLRSEGRCMQQAAALEAARRRGLQAEAARQCDDAPASPGGFTVLQLTAEGERAVEAAGADALAQAEAEALAQAEAAADALMQGDLEQWGEAGGGEGGGAAGGLAPLTASAASAAVSGAREQVSHSSELRHAEAVGCLREELEAARRKAGRLEKLVAKLAAEVKASKTSPVERQAQAPGSPAEPALPRPPRSAARGAAAPTPPSRPFPSRRGKRAPSSMHDMCQLATRHHTYISYIYVCIYDRRASSSSPCSLASSSSRRATACAHCRARCTPASMRPRSGCSLHHAQRPS